jgi:hypothetical protein
MKKTLLLSSIVIGALIGGIVQVLQGQPVNVNVGQIITTGTDTSGTCITGRLFLHRTTGVIYNCPSASHTWTALGIGPVTGGTCTNQAVTAVSSSGVPTCTTLTSSYTTGLATLVSPSFTTPSLGVATATSINGNTFTTGTYTLTGVAGKILTFNKSLTLEGTDSTTMTFPSTNATIARTDAAQTFTGNQTITHLIGGGTAPTVADTTAASCGTTAATITGKDAAGKVTVGTVSGTSCTVTFGTAWTNAPSCTVTNETTANLTRATSTTTTVILAGTFVGGDVLAYHCIGY